ncbi:MAG: hypothetical protein CMP23_05290 [Rickettsiales bacterium]|nr:hypothetical protein [Rickettsiales bacterium]|tara:strand:+ start:3699 stop:4442 length:744 start_codon:yes stop_codon:yes gene_type:complete
MQTYLLLALVLSVSSFVQGVMGFGFGMITMSLSLFLFPMQEAVPLVTGFAILLNAYLVYQLRAHVLRAPLKALLLGGLCGVPLGVSLLQKVREGYLLITLAMVIGLYVTQAFRQRATGVSDPGPWWAAFAGLWSGALGASLSTAGPPLVIYASCKPWNKDEMRATLQSFFLICCILQMVLYVQSGLMNQHLAILDVALAPVLALGSMLGLRLSRGINQAVFRNLVLAALSVLGLVFLRRGLVDLQLF